MAIVLYTSISANIEPLTGQRLAELAIDSVARADPGLDGISYLASARANGIETPLSPAYEAHILAITGRASLQDALAFIRA